MKGLKTVDLILIYNLTIISIPFIIGLLSFKKLNIALKYILLFVTVGVITEIWSAIVIKMHFDNTLYTSHFYGFFSFITLGIFYGHILKGFIKQNWIVAINILYLVYFLINSLFVQGIDEYPSNALPIGSLIILTYSILFFLKVMTEAKIKNLFAEPLIWINGALLIYNSSKLFFSVLFNLLLDHSREFSLFTVLVFLGFNGLLYLMISVGFIKKRNYSNEK